MCFSRNLKHGDSGKTYGTAPRTVDGKLLFFSSIATWTEKQKVERVCCKVCKFYQKDFKLN